MSQNIVKALISLGQTNEARDEASQIFLTKFYHAHRSNRKTNSTKGVVHIYAVYVEFFGSVYCNRCPTQLELCLGNGWFKAYHIEESYE